MSRTTRAPSPIQTANTPALLAELMDRFSVKCSPALHAMKASDLRQLNFLITRELLERADTDRVIDALTRS